MNISKRWTSITNIQKDGGMAEQLDQISEGKAAEFALTKNMSAIDRCSKSQLYIN